MKKILFGMFAAATVLFTSCSQDDFQPTQVGDEATVSINLTTPQIASRAYSDGMTATHLQYAIYDVTSGTASRLDKYTVTDETINISKNIPFKLVNGRTYRFVFWASAPNADGPYSVDFADDAATFSIDYETYADFVKTNLEDLDAFYVCEDVTVTGDMQKTFELRRPFAQVNVGTNDYAEAEAVGYVPTFSQMVVTNAYSNLDLFTGEASNPVAVTYNYNVINKDEDFPVRGHDYMGMIYTLVNKGDADLVTVKFSYKGDDGKEETRTFGSVPVQRNYRTNIFGSLLTSDVEVNIIIVPEYDGEHNYSEILTAAAVGGTVTLTEGETLSNDVIYRQSGFLNLNDNTLSLDNSTMEVTGGADLVINGPGAISKTGADVYGSTAAVYVNNVNSSVTINGGNITSDGVEAVYVAKGTAYITGGYFAAADPYNGNYFTLNCNDANYRNGTANIVVTGGTFENFNPAESKADSKDGVPANFVAQGYKSVPVTVDGKSCWTVVPESTNVVTASTTTEFKNGGDYVLFNDVTYYSNGYMPLTKDTNIDFNGHTISTYGNTSTGDGTVVGNGATVTLSNGTLNPGTNAKADGSSATINLMTGTGGKLILDNMTVIGDMYPVMMTSTSANAEIVINSGNYYSLPKWDAAEYKDQIVAVYVTSKVGKVTINGGTFGKDGVFSEYLLNVFDDARNNREPNQIITVKGGTFINFDPSNNRAEGANTNFLAPGYKVVSEVKGSNTYYTVVPQ